MDILIVDDDMEFRTALGALLHNLKYSYDEAGDGEEALEKLIKGKHQFVISDMEMPNMDGLTLCRKIREQELDYYVYIIILTGKGFVKNAVAALDAGADDFLFKPFDRDELNGRIRAGMRINQLEEKARKAQYQLMQSDKMASIGQLAAGVAHEINNPTAFVRSNLKTLQEYCSDIQKIIKKCTALAEIVSQDCSNPKAHSIAREILTLQKEKDIDFILKDSNDIVEESREGTERIKKIIEDLKDFAHPGKQVLKYADINKCLESTLNIVINEIKYKAEVFKDYGDLPSVRCYPQQINQVFMNLLVNAAQAIKEKGEIKIKTKKTGSMVEVAISDNGCGIPEENLKKVFDPFFTTKDVGKGTGLGLNVAFNIVNTHNGTIRVESNPGKGTTFFVRLPIENE